MSGAPDRRQRDEERAEHRETRPPSTTGRRPSAGRRGEQAPTSETRRPRAAMTPIAAASRPSSSTAKRNRSHRRRPTPAVAIARRAIARRIGSCRPVAGRRDLAITGSRSALAGGGGSSLRIEPRSTADTTKLIASMTIAIGRSGSGRGSRRAEGQELRDGTDRGQRAIGAVSARADDRGRYALSAASKNVVRTAVSRVTSSSGGNAGRRARTRAGSSRAGRPGRGRPRSAPAGGAAGRPTRRRRAQRPAPRRGPCCAPAPPRQRRR